MNFWIKKFYFPAHLLATPIKLQVNQEQHMLRLHERAPSVRLFATLRLDIGVFRLFLQESNEGSELALGLLTSLIHYSFFSS